jgi:hypothetical protein
MARRETTKAEGILDFFPTPPWATRAVLPLLAELSTQPLAALTCWEPACGEGHMAAPLMEAFHFVAASDVWPYGFGAVWDFLDPDLGHGPADWIITNPPFKAAVEFALLGLERAEHGVALLLRTAWAEGADRHARLFGPRPPTVIAQFSERVPMVQGRWDPDAASATSYAWFVWAGRPAETRFVWLPPGQRALHTRPGDVRRWAKPAAAPLLDRAAS